MIKALKWYFGALGVFGLAISSSKSSNATTSNTNNIDQRTTTQTGNAISASGGASLVVTDSGAINGMQKTAHDAIVAVASTRQDEIHQAFGLANHAIEGVIGAATEAQDATRAATDAALQHIQDAYAGATQPDKTLMLAGLFIVGAIAVFARRG